MESLLVLLKKKRVSGSRSQQERCAALNPQVIDARPAYTHIDA